MNRELTKLNARLNAKIAATGYQKPRYTPVMTGNSKILGDCLTEIAQRSNNNLVPARRKVYSREELASLREEALEMMIAERPEAIEEEVIELEASAETVERAMSQAAEEIEASKSTNRLEPEYVKYVKQFSPEVVDRLIGSEGEDALELTCEEEAPIVVTREKTYERMMEASNELRETVEDIDFNENEIEAARNEYKSFVELYGGSRLFSENDSIVVDIGALKDSITRGR